LFLTDNLSADPEHGPARFMIIVNAIAASIAGVGCCTAKTAAFCRRLA
jgi:hypothetical protein